MTVFHGTNADIKEDIRKGTFFSDSFSKAIQYMKSKKGNRIYAYSNSEDVINYIFNKADDNYRANQSISIDKVTCLVVEVNHENRNEV